MEILLDGTQGSNYEVQFRNDIDAEEEIARWELVRVWTKILEKYARPGARLPSAQDVRHELIEKGVEAAAKKVAAEGWMVFPWMVRDKIRKKVEKGIHRLDIDRIIADVRIAQHDPQMLQYLRDEIKNHLLFDDFH